MTSDAFRIFPDPSSLAQAAAERFITLASESIRARDRFVVALAGGSTPQAMHKLLASDLQDKVDWPRVHVYFGDERCVPPDDPRSNYHAAHQSLLAHVPIPPAQVHRIHGELPPAAAASQYHDLLRTLIVAGAGFDLIFLGIGADGHTLSLFPGHDFAADADRLAVPAAAPPESPVRDRVSVTLAAVAASRRALFLIAGKEKRPVFAQIRASRPNGREDLPASLVHCRGGVEWCLDHAAAG